MNYAEALDYLASLGTFGIQLGLTRIEALLDKLAHPERRFKSLHVTGTNGKGSTSACLAAILQAAGIRTGLYTSPHLEGYPERMRIDGEDISLAAFGEVIGAVEQAAAAIKAEGGEGPTEFEVLTAAAFLWFAREDAQYVVVEVGLGGLLDSTNVILPEVAVITNVTLEHMDKCGDTPAAIAAHKAGIIKAGRPVVTGATGAAFSVIEAAAGKLAAPCRLLNRDFWLTAARQLPGRQAFRYHECGTAETIDCEIGLLGRHQLDNAALAVAASRLLSRQEPRLTTAAIQQGLAKAAWPGRFEVVAGTPPIILDGAHNPDGIGKLRQTLDELYPARPIVFLFGVLADKDHAEMERTLFRPQDRVVVVRPDSPRAAEPVAIAAEIRGLVAAAEAAASIGQGLKRAVQLAGPAGLVCAAGSLYMIGEARRLVMAEASTRQTK